MLFLKNGINKSGVVSKYHNFHKLKENMVRIILLKYRKVCTFRSNKSLNNLINWSYLWLSQAFIGSRICLLTYTLHKEVVVHRRAYFGPTPNLNRELFGMKYDSDY